MRRRRLKTVGLYDERFNAKTNQSLPCGPVNQDLNFKWHVYENHPENAPELLRFYKPVLAKPDFVGHHPAIPNSVELVRRLGKNYLVGIKLYESADEKYLYLSTIHTISDEKLKKRLREGRLHELT